MSISLSNNLTSVFHFLHFFFLLFQTSVVFLRLDYVYACTSVVIYLDSINCTRISSFHLAWLAAHQQCLEILLFAWWEWVSLGLPFLDFFLPSTTCIFFENREQVFFFFFSSALLKYIWYVTLYRFKVYSMMIWYMYV